MAFCYYSMNQEVSETDVIGGFYLSANESFCLLLTKPSTMAASNSSFQALPAVSIMDPSEWDGPDDPENPHNWSYTKRGLVTLVIGLVGFAVSVFSFMMIYTSKN